MATVKAEKEEGMDNRMAMYLAKIQESMLATIAGMDTSAIVDTATAEIRKRITEEFGMVPVVHTVKVGDSEPVKMSGALPDEFDRVLKHCAHNDPVIMVGPAGTGKGFMARRVADALKAKFYEVNAVQQVYDLLGFVDANGRYNRTPFYDACKSASEGTPTVFLFDEIDCSQAEVLKYFNEAIASKEFTFPNDEHLEFDSLVLLAAANTYGTGANIQYTGEQLDASTRDRFSAITVKYSRTVEMEIAGGNSELVDFIDSFRDTADANGINIVVSYRGIKKIHVMEDDLPLDDILQSCLTKELGRDDIANIASNMEISSTNKYLTALKSLAK